MTTAQPGQEQRMERARDMLMRRRKDAESLGGSAEIAIKELDEAIAALTRPTADLGEELVGRLRAYRGGTTEWRDLMDEAADRLILYREALEAIEAHDGVSYRFGDEIRAIARAVLSRSGG